MNRLIRNAIGYLVITFSILMSPISSAGIISIFSDINSMNDSTSGRNQMLTNLLGAGTSVLVSKQNSANFYTDFNGFYNGLGGVTSSLTGAELNSGLLSGIDLLFINNGCCSLSGQPYSTAEISVIASFVASGGTLGLLSEPCCGGDLSGMNAFLAGIGSSMSFASHDARKGSTTLIPSFLTAGVASYNVNTFNPILGGIGVALLNGNAAVAYELIGETKPVPAPATLALFGLGLAGLGWSRRKKV